MMVFWISQFVFSQSQQCGAWNFISVSVNTSTYSSINCGTNATSSVTCTTPKVFYGGSCLESCPGIMLVNTHNMCTPCAIGCGGCSLTNTNCDSCIFNYTKAPNGQCYTPCNSTTCLPCPLNYYLDTISNICYPCPSPLCGSTCNLSQSYCQQCLNGTFNSTTTICTPINSTFTYTAPVTNPQATLGIVCGVILGMTVLILACYFIGDRMQAKKEEASRDKKTEKDERKKLTHI